MAFCHKVSVEIAKVAVGLRAEEHDIGSPPDMNQPVLLEVQEIQVHGNDAKVMFDNRSTAVLVTHSFAEKARLQGRQVAYWLVVVGHDRVLRHTTLYTFFMEDNYGQRHEIQGYGIDKISEDSIVLDLDGVKAIFPGAPREVYQRPAGSIDILVGSMYKNIQPYGGDSGFTKGRLRLVKSLFGCGYILTGTHPSIVQRENCLTAYAQTLANCTVVGDDTDVLSNSTPVVRCN